MNSLNSVLIEGNLEKDPVLISSESDIPVCSFTICSTRNYKRDDEFIEELSFFDIQCSGPLANICMRDCKKDSDIRVVGRLKQIRDLDDKNNSFSNIVIVAEHVELRPFFRII